MRKFILISGIILSFILMKAQPITYTQELKLPPLVEDCEKFADEVASEMCGMTGPCADIVWQYAYEMCNAGTVVH